MRLPAIKPPSLTRHRAQLTFGGLNYSEDIRESEFSDCQNLSSARFPAMSPRRGRDTALVCSDTPRALYVWDKLALVDGTDFIYGGEVRAWVTPGPKQMCCVGKYLYIMPDKFAYDLERDEVLAQSSFITLPWGNGARMSYDMNRARCTLSFPERYMELVPDGEGTEEEQGIFFGPWDRGNTRVSAKCPGKYGGYEIKSLYYNQLAAGMFLSVGGQDEESYVREITVVKSETREYIAGVERGYYTATWRRKLEMGYEYGTAEGWAYCDDPRVTGMRIESASNLRAYELKPVGYYDQETGVYTYTQRYADRGYKPKYRLEPGEFFNYDKNSREADRVVSIEAGEYAGGWYIKSIALEHCVTREVFVYPDLPALFADEDVPAGANVYLCYGGSRYRASVGEIGNALIVPPVSDVMTAPEPKWMLTLSGFSAGSGVPAPPEGNMAVQYREDTDFDYICEHEGRMWGVSGNTIQCSALGVPGVIEHSYTVGSAGDFTGVVSYSGSLLCFKENCVHKLVGNGEDAVVETYNVAGIEPGSAASAAVINEVLYYKGRSGVYAYSGYMPKLISKGVVGAEHSGAVGGTDGRNYYISAERRGGGHDLFVYDTINGVWLREDGLRVSAFGQYRGRLYCAAPDDGVVYAFGGEAVGDAEWYGVTAPFYENTFRRKSFGRLTLRAVLEPGSQLAVFVSFDGGAWEEVWRAESEIRQAVTIPLRMRRCDGLRVKFAGHGDVTIYGLEREYRAGGRA